MQEYLNNKFGMFIHWGLYSLIAHGEWVMYNGKDLGFGV